MTKHYPDDDAVAHVGRRFTDRTLPKPEWTHAGHFAAALWLLRERPDLDLRAEMPGMIRAYNAATGVENNDTSGYHETITLASIDAAESVLAASGGAPLHKVVDVLMETELGRSDWMLSYWSKDRLFSVEARRGWVPPDIQPLPAKF